MKKANIIEAITILYVILFLYTGISKIIDYTIFKEQIAISPILAPVAKPIAIFLPWLEFTIVLLLTIPRWRLKGLYVSATLMILFTAYIIFILTVNENIPCSCGGIIELLSWKQHILFNAAFIVLAILAILLQKKENKLNQKKWGPVVMQ